MKHKHHRECGSSFENKNKIKCYHEDATEWCGHGNGVMWAWHLARALPHSDAQLTVAIICGTLWLWGWNVTLWRTNAMHSTGKHKCCHPQLVFLLPSRELLVGWYLSEEITVLLNSKPIRCLPTGRVLSQDLSTTEEATFSPALLLLQ